MTTAQRIIAVFSILGFLFAGLAVHPAKASAAEPEILMPAFAYCDTATLQSPLLWYPKLGTMQMKESALRDISRGDADCQIYFGGQQVTFLIVSPVELNITGIKGQSNGFFTYLITTAYLTFHLSKGNYASFSVAVIIAADFVDLSQSIGPLQEARYFKETGHNLDGRFLTYWQEHGGLAQFGHPLTEPFWQSINEGFFLVQYFERARFEYHPENSVPYVILLGQFGRVIGQSRLVSFQPAVRAKDDTCMYDIETSHNLCGSFGEYWRAHGGLSQFGHPLTEPFTERLENGNTYEVQYFERARFEYHPENPAPYDVLLGQFGRPILAATQIFRDVSSK